MADATWFERARFGMFVHWGHSSQQEIELSWPLVGGVFVLPKCQSVPVEEYHSTSATFDPKEFDAVALAQRAKRCGMQYAVLTAKHHDGYAMFDTKLSDYSVTKSCGRDIVREYAEAMRAEGLRVGLYYSLSDWHHPDYPAFTDADRPYQFPVGKPVDAERWPRYVEFMHGQVRELLTNYGEIVELWFDGGWERTPDMWRADELIAMVRGLQPGIMVNDRLPGHGDFTTPEQFVPAEAPAGPWEVCMTMNVSWGWNPSDTEWKGARQMVHMLCEIAGKGGNLLLNVSPKGDGSLPAENVERLEAIEAWMSRNGESIVGTEPGLEPWQFYGPSTKREGTVYLHLLMRPYESVTVRGVPIRRVRAVRSLSTGEALEFSTRAAIIDSVQADPKGELTIEVPPGVVDEYATVIAVEVAEG